MNYLIAISFWIFAFWLIRRDMARREGLSSAIWIPSLWAFILLSRPVTVWLGFGGGDDSMEGSPLDRLFYLVMIALALWTLSKRGVNWSMVVSKNWPIFLFYAYLLISVTWADAPVVSFKRWFKDFGNIFVALVVLTEPDPLQAIRAIFVRCAYVLMPLSVIFVRYFPDMGRRYSKGGGMEVTGATMQKNSLGILVVICGFALLWDWMERTRSDRMQLTRIERSLPFIFFLLGVYLLYQCDSETSIICLILGGTVMFAQRIPFLKNHTGAIGILTLTASGAFFVLDWMFDIKEAVVGSMGRDMTFTGRTDVWRALLDLKTDPLIGTGFCMIWSDRKYLDQLPDGVGVSAHNGYLETYIDGGMLGVFFLIIMLLAAAWRINRQIGKEGLFSLFRFAILLAILIGDFSESHFGRMSPLFFVFLLVSLELPWRTWEAPEAVVIESHRVTEEAAGVI